MRANGITRNVFVLGLVSFFTDISSEMLYPIIPLFLTGTLRAPVPVIGLIEGAAEATASVLKALSGWWSDRSGARRSFVIAGYGLSALTRPMLALAAGWPLVLAARVADRFTEPQGHGGVDTTPLVLAARVADRFGKGLRGPPRDALIADSTPDPYRGRAFGFHRSMDQAGAIVGPLLALPLLALVQQNYRALFLIAFLPSAVSTALVLLVRERRQEPARAAFPLQTVRVHAAFRRFLIAIALFSIGNSSDAFVILRAQQLGLDTQRIVLLFAASNVTYVLSAYPAGRFSDRMERRKLFAAGLAVFAGVYAGLAAVPSAGWLWLLFPVYGFYMGLTDGVSRAMVVDFVAPQERAGALGLQAALAGACALPASVIAGQLWQRLGPPAPFLYGAVMATASLAYLLLFVRGRR